MSARQQAAAAAAVPTQSSALAAARSLHEGRSEVEQLAIQHQQARSVSLLDVAPRPDRGGTSGRPIDLKVNMYSVGLAVEPAAGSRGGGGGGLKVREVYHYSVQIIGVDSRPVGARSQQATASVSKALPVRLQHEVFEAALSTAVKNGLLSKDVATCLAFDGRANAYSSEELPGRVTQIEAQLTPRVSENPGAAAPAGLPDRKFSVTLTRVAIIDLDVLLRFCKADRGQMQQIGNAVVADLVSTALQALEILIRHDPTKRYKVHGAQGRRFFDPSLAVPISNGAEIWKGFFQSVRPTQGGLVVNIDVAFSAFLGGGDFLTVCAKVLGISAGAGGGGRGGFRGGRGAERGRGGDRGRGGERGRGGRGGGFAAPPAQAPQMTNFTPLQQRQLRKSLRGAQLRITYRPGAKLEKFAGFSTQSAAQSMFTDSQGKSQSVVSFLKEKHNYTVRFPHLPCVLVGGETKIPPECCIVVPGTPLPPLSLSPAQVQDMISQSALKPADREQRIAEIRGDLAYEKSERVTTWGVDVAPQQVQLKGRVLAPPTVSYAQNRSIRTNNGGWNLANVKFNASGRPLICWCVVNFTRTPQQAVLSFVTFLINTLRGLSVKVENLEPVYFDASRCQEPAMVQGALREAGRQAHHQAKAKGKAIAPQLFLCVMERNDQSFYNAIKKAAALELMSPVPSQVVNTKKALNERGMAQYCANVAMKINVKLGGTNQAVAGGRDLPGLGDQTMLIGVDVTHAGPGTTLPSIAAAVATMDGQRQRYSSQIRVQRNPRGGSQEIVLESQPMFLAHLKAWTGRAPPSSIIVFRDGVSEGQYAAALDTEVQALKLACEQFKAGYQPKITYVIAGKRHHVRFFAQNPKDNDQRSASLPAGTVVDKTAVHPFAFDFYLQAHGGLVGTPRPTHYVVLLDENKFNSDSLQTVVNSLCYSYSRATRSVSLVPPAYYADVLAEKARALVYGDDASETATSAGAGSRSTQGDFDATAVMEKLKRDPNFVNSQWYM